jgi:nucleotide-binding universal stress UspA family protein
MFDQILIAHDGSDSARKAFDVAVEITAKLGARLRMICVEEEIPRHAEVIDEYQDATRPIATSGSLPSIAGRARRCIPLN